MRLIREVGCCSRVVDEVKPQLLMLVLSMISKSHRQLMLLLPFISSSCIRHDATTARCDGACVSGIWFSSRSHPETEIGVESLLCGKVTDCEKLSSAVQII